MNVDFEARASWIQGYVDSMKDASRDRAQEAHEWLWRLIAAKVWERP